MFISIAIFLVQMDIAALLEPTRQNNPQALVNPHLPSIVRIIAYGEKGRLLREGAGFFVNHKGEIITLFQVLEGAARADIKLSTGQTLPLSKLISSDPDTNLLRVSLATTQNKITPFPISEIAPQKGEKVTLVLEGARIQEGTVSEIKTISSLTQHSELSSTVSTHEIRAPIINKVRSADHMLTLNLDTDLKEATGGKLNFIEKAGFESEVQVSVCLVYELNPGPETVSCAGGIRGEVPKALRCGVDVNKSDGAGKYGKTETGSSLRLPKGPIMATKIEALVPYNQIGC